MARRRWTTDRERDDPKAFAIALGKGEGRSQRTVPPTFASKIDRLRLLYQQGMAEMKGITTPYPDANSTLRFSYGNVKGYQPREAEFRTPFTTMKGMIEKDTGVNPFDMPQKLKDAAGGKGFRPLRRRRQRRRQLPFDHRHHRRQQRLADPERQRRAGRPCFDGNFEGLGNDFYYDPNYNRTISVDIRFVLFVTEKFGGAKWVVDEMKVVGGKG